MSHNISHPHPQHHTLLQTALLSSKLNSLDVGSSHQRSSSVGSIRSDDDESVAVYTPGRDREGAVSPSLESTDRKRGSSLTGKDKKLILGSKTDPVRAFPSQIGIKIFGQLDFRSLARCARVSKRWSQSHTINYVWFLHFKEYKFSHGEDTVSIRKPNETGVADSQAGRWSRKESKEDWRRAYWILTTTHPDSHLVPYDPVDSPYNSGTSTPNRWAADAAAAGVYQGPLGPITSKDEARDQYKALKGRKARTKRQMAGGGRDKGMAGVDEDPYGDGRFDAPW